MLIKITLILECVTEKDGHEYNQINNICPNSLIQKLILTLMLLFPYEGRVPSS